MPISSSVKPTAIHLPPRAPEPDTSDLPTYLATEARHLSVLHQRLEQAREQVTAAGDTPRALQAQQQALKLNELLSARCMNVTNRIMSTACRQAPLNEPRSTHRVSYSVGGVYTVSSSPPPLEVESIQLHTHRHTDASGNVVSKTADFKGDVMFCAPILSMAADSSLHLHLHTFNDPKAPAAPGRGARPMHLYVDPRAPRTPEPRMHDGYAVQETAEGPRLMVKKTAAERARDPSRPYRAA